MYSKFSSSGSKGAIVSANTAANAITIITTAPADPSGCLRSIRSRLSQMVFCFGRTKSPVGSSEVAMSFFR